MVSRQRRPARERSGLVVWRDYRTQNAQVYAARVTRDGRVLDPDGILVSLADYDVSPWNFAIASNGSGLLAVWRGYDNATGTSAMYATELDGAGAVVGHIRLADAGTSPTVAWNGRRYLVAWIGADEDHSILALRITKGKVDRDPMVLSSSGPAWKSAPKVASDGEDFFVAWADARSGSSHVYGTRVTSNGRVLDPGGKVVFGDSEYNSVSGVAWDGAHYVVASRLNLIRVSQDGVVVDPDGIPIPTTTPASVSLTGLAAGPLGDVALLIKRTMREPPYNHTAKAFVRVFHEEVRGKDRNRGQSDT